MQGDSLWLSVEHRARFITSKGALASNDSTHPQPPAAFNQEYEICVQNFKFWDCYGEWAWISDGGVPPTFSGTELVSCPTPFSSLEDPRLTISDVDLVVFRRLFDLLGRHIRHCHHFGLQQRRRSCDLKLQLTHNNQREFSTETLIPRRYSGALNLWSFLGSSICGES